ncbi:toluene-4-monooxygenase system B family protein [Nonomuraea sp. NPDC050404]|uniref:toluene-4-monooxygenase system B family protein n=1 Tax=Nonomuraea sp. NPDC050404 TaxID=3155783 RepID=UPI0033DF4875
MALLPLSASFRGDIAVLLVLVDDQDTAEVVGRKIAVHVAGRRAPAGSGPVRVRHEGRILPAGQRVGEAGLSPLDYVEAFFDER